MTDQHAAKLKRAAADYRRAKKRADDIVRPAREALAAAVTAAYAKGKGMRKSEILTAIDHVWSRQWLDETVGTQPRAAKRATRRRNADGPASTA